MSDGYGKYVTDLEDAITFHRDRSIDVDEMINLHDRLRVACVCLMDFSGKCLSFGKIVDNLSDIKKILQEMCTLEADAYQAVHGDYDFFPDKTLLKDLVQDKGLGQ